MALLQKLRAGEIGAYAAESYGADLSEWCATTTAESLVKKVFTAEHERQVALRSLGEQRESTKYLWTQALGYLAVSEQLMEVVSFCGQNRLREGQCTVPKTVWKFAFIDESRSVVIYDDFGQLWRKEYMHVQIDDAAFRRIRRDFADTKPTQVGRRSVFRSDVIAYAEALMSGGNQCTLEVFIKSISDNFKDAGSRNTIDNHYGDVWRLARGRPPKVRKPKTQNPNN